MPGKEEQTEEVKGIDFSSLKEEEPNISTSQEVDGVVGIDFSSLGESEAPKKAPVTPIAEKEIEEPVVAQNNQDALPIELRGPEKPGQSFLSGSPSQDSGLGSQSSGGKELEPYSWALEQLKTKQILSVDEDEKAEVQKQIDDYQFKDNSEPAWESKVKAQAAAFEIATKPDVLTKDEMEAAGEGIEADLERVEDDDNATDEQKEEARATANKQKQELIDNQAKGKERELGDLIKGSLNSVKEAVGSEDNIKKGYTTFINSSKKKISKRHLDKEILEEYKINEKRDDLISYDAVMGGLSEAVIPHNASLRIDKINNSENKEEELAVYKKELLNQIAEDNKVLGNNLNEITLKRYANKEVKDIAAIANSLSDRRDKVNAVKGEKQEFLAKKHKGVQSEIDDLNARLIDESETLNPDEKKYITDLITKNENIKASFFEEDGAKAEKLVNSGVNKGSVAYNAYADILKNIPQDLSSKEKFDMFYITFDKVVTKALGDADLLDENGNYEPTVENVFRDWLGVESVMGVDFSGEMIGSLTTEEVDAMQLKGKLDDLTNIFLNNTAYSSPNYWDEFMSSLATGLAPNMVRAGGTKQSDTTKSAETIGTLSGLGVTEGEGVDKESLQAFNDLVATPEKGVTVQKFMATAGGSTAIMAELITGTALLKLGKIGKVGKVLKKVTDALNKTRGGRLIVASTTAGVNAEFTGQLFNDEEELAFEQFAVSTVGSKIAEKLLTKGGGKIASVFIKTLGVGQKAALDFTGKLVSNAFGELTDETLQEITKSYKKSDSLKGTAEELRKQYPDMDAATEFIILTSLMGAIFKLPVSVTEIRTKLKDGGYDTSKADAILEELSKEYKKAADIINEADVIDEGGKLKEEKEAEVVAPPEVIIDESGKSKYVNKEGLFFAKEEVAKMTPEQLSEMVITNPSVEVQANLDKAAEVAGEAIETTPEGETETTEETEAVQAEEVTTEPVAEVEQTEVEAEAETEAEFVKAGEGAVLRGGDSFVVGDDHYQVNKVDKDFNIHVTVDGEEKVLDRWDYGNLKRKADFELFKPKGQEGDVIKSVEEAEEYSEEDVISRKRDAIKGEDGSVEVEEDFVIESKDGNETLTLYTGIKEKPTKLPLKKGYKISENDTYVADVVVEGEGDNAVVYKIKDEIYPAFGKSKYIVEVDGETKKIPQSELDEKLKSGKVRSFSYYSTNESEIGVTEEVQTEPVSETQEEVVEEAPVAEVKEEVKKIKNKQAPKIPPLPPPPPGSKRTMPKAPPEMLKIDIGTLGEKRNKNMFPDQETFGGKLKSPATISKYTEKNGVPTAEYTNPATGTVDVYISGTGDNSYTGFIRVYKNGKPTNRFTSKFENKTGTKEDFKKYIQNAQEFLPEGHEYTEETSISTDGIRVYKQQLDRGYEILTDKDGNPVTNKVAINGDSKTNILGVDVKAGEFEQVIVSDKEFESVKKILTPLISGLGLTADDIVLENKRVKINLPVLKHTGKTKTAGETKTEVKTEKQTKAEVKKAKEAKKLEAAEKAESRNNTLVDTVKEYNKKDATQKKKKENKALLDKARKMAEDQGHTFEIKEDGSVKVTDSKGKEVKVSNEFKKKKHIPEVASQDQAWAVNQIVEKGALKDGTGVRMTYESDVSGDVTLESSEIKSGIAQIKKGNFTSDNAKKVLAAMADSRKKGFYEVSTGSGSNVKYDNVLIEESAEGEFSEEELVSKEALDAESAAKAEEQTQAKKIQDATDSFVEKIKKLKYTPPGSFKSTVGAVELYNGAIDLIAATVKTGGTAAAAVAKAIAHIKSSDWYKKKLPADRKKIIADVEADLKEKAKEIEKQARAENAAEEIEVLEKKRKAKEQGKTKAETLRESISEKDPKRRDKISKHFKTLLENPTISQETKDSFQEYSNGKYETTTNEKDIQAATDAVRAFDQEGLLDELIDDVAANFTSWGPTGNFILEASMVHYSSLGATADAARVAEKKLRLISITGAILQSSGITLTDDQITRLMKTAMTVISDVKNDIKTERDTKLDQNTDSNDPESKTKKEQILEGITDLEEAIKQIASIATKDPKIQKAIEKAFGKGKPESKPKTRSEKHKAELKKEVKKRAKIIADVKKNMGKNFYSSFGVTPEGIEMIGDLAASYVRSGITSVKMLADKLRTVLKDEFDVDISDTDLEKVMTYTGKDGQTAKDLIELQKDMVSEVLKKKILKSLDGKETKSTKKAIDLIADSLFGKFKDTAPKSGTPVSKVDQRKKMIDLMLEKDFSTEQWEKAKTSIKEKLDGDLDSEKITQEEYDKTMNKLDSFFGDKVKLPFSDKLVDKVIREDLKKRNKSLASLVEDIYNSIGSSDNIIEGISYDILKDSGLSDSEISELKEVIEERLQNMVSVSLAKKIDLENKREQARQAKEAKKEQAKQAKEIENAPENKLAKKIVNEVSKKEKKNTADAVEVMIRNLFSKAKEGLPKKSDTDTKASYREKLIEGMSGQEFSKQVWEDSKTTVENILEGKESSGEITGAERGQILKDLDSYFEGKVGTPFAKKLVGDSIKEQLKSNEETIQDIVNEHYSNRKARGESLAQKIMVNTEGLSEEEVDNLSEIIQKQFGEMVKESAHKALTKSLGINPDGSVKVKDDATLDEIIKAINQGALTENAYIDAFGKRFNFATMTTNDVKRLNKFVFDIMHLGPKSGALAKEVVEFNTYLDKLKMTNARLRDKIAHYLSDVFITNILGSFETVIRGSVGIFFTGPISALTASAEALMWLGLKSPKKLLSRVESMYDEKNLKGELKKTQALLYYWGRILKDRKSDVKGSMKDIFKDSFTSYEVGQENLFGSAGRKGILHDLVDTRFGDFENTWKGNSKRAIRMYSYIAVMGTKALGASDILYDAAMRPHLATTYAIKKMLIDGENLPKNVQEFWTKIAKLTNSTAEAEKAARLQAENELDVMLDKGVNTKNFDMERRVKEILWQGMDADVRAAAERKAAEGRLGHNPEGTLGMFTNWLNKGSKKSRGARHFIMIHTAPFMKIPSNAINLALDYTPIGFLRAALGRGAWIKPYFETKSNEKARERARIGRGFLESVQSKYKRNKGKEKNEREYSGEMLMSDRTDMLIRASLGTALTAGAYLLMYSGLGKEDDDEDNRFQIMGAGKEKYSDNKNISQGENRTGVEPYHLRFKYPGTNTWGPWIDYTDMPFSVGLTMVGTLSDEMLYGDKEDVADMDDVEKWNKMIDPDLLGSAAWEGMIAFKQKSYLQAINDLTSMVDFDKNAKMQSGLIKGYNFLARPVKGTLYPQFFNNTWKASMAIGGSNKKNVTSAKESIWRNFRDKTIENTPFSFMLDDYVDNSGENIKLGLENVPFSSLMPGLNTAAPMTASDEIMQGRDKLNKHSLFGDPLVGRVIVNDEGKELSFSERKDYADQYKEKMGVYIEKNFKKLNDRSKETKLTDKELVELMSTVKTNIHNQVIKDNKADGWQIAE